MQWLYDHFIITSIVMLTFMGLIVAVTLKVFFDPVDIPAGTAAAFGTFFALPGIAVGVLKWRRTNDRNSGQ